MCDICYTLLAKWWPLKRYIHILIPGTCEHYLTLQNMGLRLRGGSYLGLSRQTLNTITWGEAVFTWRHTRVSHVKKEAKFGVMKPHVRQGWQPAEARRGKKRALPSSLQRKQGSAGSLISTSAFLSCERTLFCHSKPPSWW